jgi:hypothetical protein
VGSMFICSGSSSGAGIWTPENPRNTSSSSYIGASRVAYFEKFIDLVQLTSILC